MLNETLSDQIFYVAPLKGRKDRNNKPRYGLMIRKIVENPQEVQHLIKQLIENDKLLITGEIKFFNKLQAITWIKDNMDIDLSD